MDITSNLYPDLARYGLEISKETSTVRIGHLIFESPIHLWENSSFYGPCSIGAFSYINRFSMFYNLHVGRFCSIAGFVRGVSDHDISFSTHPIWTDMSHGLFPSDPIYIKITGERFKEYSKNTNAHSGKENAIKIGNDVWIGENVLIRAGIKIGDGSIIGANSFVRNDVPAYSVVAGSPAVVKKMRYSDKIKIKLEELSWWLYKPSSFYHLIDKSNIEKTIDQISEKIAEGKIEQLNPNRYSLTQVSGSFRLELLS